ncbi:hypothetical protein ACFQJD_06250 [Haloplanus sp. GCM10025708]|uniref:DUF7576 family protein n=1 Tax=Haloferacaceae TaxID=1644056 RepID=UPI00361EB035
MVDPTSDLGEDVDEDDAPTCVTCGKKIVEEPAHRVVSWVEGGVVEHRHFCSDECESSWHETNPAQ